MGSPRCTLIVAILGSSLAFLDGSVVNVALPVMQSELGIGAGLAAWVIEAYALLLSSLVLVGGALGDHYGRKRIFVTGVVVFALSSLICGAAGNAHLLVAARAVQGTGAALLVPGSLSLITAAYPEAARGRAIGLWSTFSAVTTAAGPVAGGYVVAHASWRWIFLFNVPLAAAIVLLARRGVAETRDEEAPRRMDWIGAALAAMGLGAIIYALLDDAASAGPLRCAILPLGAAVLLGFVVYEWRAPAPMVPLGLFRSRVFSATNVLTLLLYGALGGGLYFLPFNLIQVQGYAPTEAGAALLPFVVAISALSPPMGALAGRIGSRPLLVVGPLLAAAGFALMALPGRGGSYWTAYFPGIATAGVGMGVTVAPLTTAVMGSVESHRAGVASGINNAVARAASLLAIAGLAVVLRARFDDVLDHRLADLHLAAPVAARVAAERSKLAAADLGGLDSSTLAALRDAIDSAYVAGFRALAIACAILAATSALLGLAVGPSRAARQAREAGS
ncbi:MAG TPA: MFS transporter [Polyangiaceae bacterium]